MKVDESASKDVHTIGGCETPTCVGLTSNTLPKAQNAVSAESSQTGVSIRNAHTATKPKAQKEKEVHHCLPSAIPPFFYYQILIQTIYI